MIIDANNLIVGRLGTFVAKQALLGETIDVVNAEKAIFTGSKETVYAKYKAGQDRGIPGKGPIIFKREDRFLKRVIRGMLPYKQEKGRKAFDRVKCHIGIPEEMKGKEMQTVEGANIKKAKTLKYIRVGEVCKLLGKKV